MLSKGISEAPELIAIFACKKEGGYAPDKVLLLGLAVLSLALSACGASPLARR